MGAVQKYHLPLLFLVWCAMHFWLYKGFGILTNFEGEKYTREAHQLINGTGLSSKNFIFYSTQIGLNVLAIKTGTWPLGIIVIQLLVNLFSLIFFYRVCRELSNSTVAFILTALLILCWPYQVFNLFSFTESVFFSLLIFLSGYLFRLKTLNFSSLLVIGLLSVFLCFTRPTGLLIIPGVVIYLLIKFLGGKSIFFRAGIFTGILVIALMFLNFALGSGGEFDFMLPYKEEILICGVPTVSTPVNINETSDPNSVGGLLYYITHNAGQFLSLAAKKGVLFWSLQRSYFSTMHNLSLIFFFYPLYILAGWGIVLWFKKDPVVAVYILTFIILVFATVLISCDDWHNRFFLALTPFLLWLALPAFRRFFPG